MIRNQKGQFIKGIVPKNKSNLINQKFGLLLVIKETAERKNGKIVWLCRCKCGNFTKVQTAKLRNGHTKSCGCLKHIFKDMSGQRFGRLLVMRKVIGKRSCGGSIIWLCKCDCGQHKEISQNRLQQGQKSCGCLLDEYKKATRVFADYVYLKKEKRNRSAKYLSDSYIVNVLTNQSRGSKAEKRENVTAEMIIKKKKEIRKKRELFDNISGMQKRCTVCLQIKEYKFFSPEKPAKGGIASVCKECVNNVNALCSKNLGDRYIKTALRNTHNIYDADVTDEMIKLKRELIIFYRLKKELTDGINSRGNKRTETNGQVV